MRLVILNGVRYHLDCSQDYFHSAVPAIIADIQNMNDTQTGDQKWFNREDKWKISNRFGTVDVEIISPVIKKAEELKLQEGRTIYFPVPVFAMFDPEGYSYNGDFFDSFWVCLQQSWNPAVIVDVSENNFLVAEIPIFNVSSDEEIFPLDKISVANLAVDDLQTVNSENDPAWDPGAVYLTAFDFLAQEATGPWLGPNVSWAYWIDDGYCMEQCPPPWDTLCYHSMGDFITSSVDITASLLTWDNGSDAYNSLWYSFFIAYGRYEVTTSCDILRTELSSNIVDYRYREYEWLPLQHIYVEEVSDNSNSITMNDIEVYSSSSISIIRTDYYAQPTRDMLTEWGVINDSISGSDIWLLADCANIGYQDLEDYRYWCVVMEEYDYGNQSVAINVPDLSASGIPPVFDIPSRDGVVFSYIHRIIIKIDTEEIFTIYEYEFSDYNDYSNVIGYCEIYSFFGEPVYIVGVSLTPGSDESPSISKFAMIYKGNIILSEEFQNIPYTTPGSAWKSDIFGSIADRNLAGYVYAAAAGIKISKSSNAIIKEV